MNAFRCLHTELTAALVVAAIAWPCPAASPGAQKLRLSRGRQINFSRGNHVMTDGGGYRWDIQYAATVGQGTNYAYGNGMHLQIGGSNFRPSSRSGWANKAGDEIELGPWSRNGLRIHRRVKVYKDRPMARWLDVFENPTSRDISVSVAIYTYFNYGLQQTITNTGANHFGERDWAFRTKNSRHDSPYTLHVVTSDRAKIRPNVQVQGNQIYVRYNLVVPANRAVILCHFESQNSDPSAHDKLMKKFPTYRLLKDLPGPVRSMIVNMRVRGGFGEMDLDRSSSADTVVVDGGGPKYGKITNESFDLETSFGPLKLPAAKVVGMAAAQGQGQSIRFALTDGQIVSAKLPQGAIALSLPTGGVLKIPFGRIKRWSYRVGPDRPEEGRFTGAFAMLRTGDRLAFDPGAVKLSLRTRHGLIALDGRALLRVDLDNVENGVHQAFYRNGSHLGGFLEPRTIPLKLTLGPTLEIARGMVVQLRFSEEDKPGDGPTHVVLTNEDELFGRFAEKVIRVTSEFGQVEVKPGNIRAITFSATHLGQAELLLWDGTKLTGQMGAKPLSFALGSQVLKIHPAQMVSVVCPQALPPDEMVARARKLIAMLGAESYKDRQDATDKLIEMGPSIAPILRKHAASDDPEVRQRIEKILQSSKGKTPPAVNQENPMMGGMMMFK